MNDFANRFQKRLSKKARHGFRGWPVATIAFYGPDLSRASKVAVGIIRFESAEAEDMTSRFADDGDVRNDPLIAQHIVEFIKAHGARSVGMGGPKGGMTVKPVVPRQQAGKDVEAAIDPKRPMPGTMSR
jgi:hypothetical protein